MSTIVLRASLKRFKNNGFSDFRPSQSASVEAILSRNAFVRNVWRVTVRRVTLAPWLMFFWRGSARRKLEVAGKLRQVFLKMRVWIYMFSFKTCLGSCAWVI